MEEKIIRRCTILIVGVSISICCLMYYLPAFTSFANNKILEYRKIRQEEIHRQEMSALELLRFHERKIAPKEQEEIGAAIRIYLGDEIDVENVSITNDYRQRQVELFFPGLSEDVLNRYPIVGSSNHIDDMNVWSDEQGLYIEIMTERIIEPVIEQKEEYCYLYLKNPWEVFDKILVVDAGHGGRKPGTVMDGAKEKDINLKIVKNLKKYLEENEEIKVYYTREKDIDISLEERAKLANEVHANLFLSIHQNALWENYNSTAGTQVLYNEDDGKKLSSKKFAKIVLRNVTQQIGSVDKGIIPGNRIYIVRSANMPVALIEVGFVTNKEEHDKLLSSQYQDQVAKALYDSILEAFEKGF